MKSLGFVSISALFLLSLTPRPAVAQEYAQGSYRFYVEEDDAQKLAELDVKADEKGLASGWMTFTDQTLIPDVDGDAEEGSGETPREIYFSAAITGMDTEKNRAVMSGTIRESSHKSYVGKAVQLVVEDNGSGLEIPDRITWQACRLLSVDWVPADAERRDDDGAYLRWWATDAERDDDVGIPSEDLLAGQTSCPVYPVWFYTFPELRKWEGDIVVVQR